METILVSASMDASIRLWDVVSQKQIEALPYKESQVNYMCITPDGAQLIVAAWQNIRIYDLNSLSPAGLHTSTVHEKNVTSVGFQAEGAWMYTGGEDCMAKIWDMRVNQLNCQRIFQLNTPVHSVALHPNQVELLIADSTGAIYLWDLRSDRDDSLITEVDMSEYVVHIDIDKLGGHCAAVTNRGHLFFWDISHAGMIVPHLLECGEGEGISSEQNPKVDCQSADNLCSAEHDTGLPPIAPPPELTTFNIPQQRSSETELPANVGESLEGSDQNGQVSPQSDSNVDTKPTEVKQPHQQTNMMINSSRPCAKVRAHRTFALKCRYRPDGLAVATTSADQTTKLWSVHDHKMLSTFSIPGNKWVWDCSFTNDSSHMITATSDGILRMWNLNSGEVVRKYQGHSMGITAMTFRDSR